VLPTEFAGERLKLAMDVAHPLRLVALAKPQVGPLRRGSLSHQVIMLLAEQGEESSDAALFCA